MSSKAEYVKQYTLNTLYTNNGDISAPKWNLPANQQKITGVRISSCEFVNSFNVIDSRNNVLNFSEGGSTTQNKILIPTGNYYPTGFGTEIALLLSSIGNYQYSSNYNTQNNTLSFSSGTGGTFVFNSVGSNAYYEMGLLSVNNKLVYNTASSSISTGFVDLSGTKIVNLICSDFIELNLIVGSNYNCLASIPLGNNFASVVQYINPVNTMISCDQRNLNTISIKLFDEFMRPITALNNWQLGIQFTKER